MAQSVVLHKILNVKEEEKNNAQKEKAKATDRFEEVARSLYAVLKKKEQAEESFHHVMRDEATITKIKEQSLYIESLNKKIALLQHKVNQARKQLEAKQEELTEAHVEVKKIEKMIDKREQDKRDHERKLDMAEMDEISIRQFMMHVQNG